MNGINLLLSHKFFPKILFIIHCFVLIMVMFCLPVETIRVVRLNVPSYVYRGDDLELSCLFDLGNNTLYSLKWFYRAHEWERDEQEFFRYTPRHRPYKQVFPLDGIHVDLSKSTGSVVYIRDADFKTSGSYKCEISVEETFEIVYAEKLMTVLNSSSLSIKPSYLVLSLVWSFNFLFKV